MNKSQAQEREFDEGTTGATKMSLTPQERYQHKPFGGSSHSWAIGQVSGLPPETRVLDVGPGSGVMGDVLKELGVLNLSAVEIDADARAHIAPIYSRVEESLDPFLDEQFDLILLLDVMEHMANPFEFYQTISTLLAPGGTVLISLPNIAHWSVRIPLLFGMFHYTQRGILDKTHLQFFTRKRLLELLGSTPALRIQELSASIEPVEFILPPLLWKNPLWDMLSKLRVGVANFIPGLMAYQLLARVEKPHASGDA